MDFPFVGSSYQYRSSNYDLQRSINLYPIKSEVGTSKAITALVSVPGYTSFALLPDSPIRATHEVNGRAFAVAGYGLYEIFSNGSYILRGSLLTNSGYVSVANNGFQICMVDGTVTGGFILTLATNAYAQITNPYFLGANTVTFIDGYFMFNKPNTQIYYISALYDGLSGDPLDFASAEASPDNLVAVKEIHKQVWLFGTSTIEPVFNTGAADFPFSPNQGAVIEYGCAAAQSIATTANTIFWIGSDREGTGIVFMTNGSQPQRISNNVIERLLQSVPDLSTATAYTYQEDGHYFYIINVDGLDTSLVFDINTQEWHERAFWNTNGGNYERHRAQSHIFAFGKHLIGDYANGNIYQQSLDIYTFNGQPLRRLRRSPYFADDLEYLFFSRLQIDMETGIGLDGAASSDTAPTAALRWTDDGGHTWSNEYSASLGALGNYNTRVIWRRLGRSRSRAFEFVTSVACKIFIISAKVQVEKGTS